MPVRWTSTHTRIRPETVSIGLLCACVCELMCAEIATEFVCVCVSSEECVVSGQLRTADSLAHHYICGYLCTLRVRFADKRTHTHTANVCVCVVYYFPRARKYFNYSCYSATARAPPCVCDFKTPEAPPPHTPECPAEIGCADDDQLGTGAFVPARFRFGNGFKCPAVGLGPAALVVVVW